LSIVRKASFEDMNCSIARSLEVIGEWWTLLILRDAFLGITRFEDWTERLGIARNMLSTRLDTLVEAGVMERQIYDEARDRADYVLTAKGRALWPVLVTIREWGDEWVMEPGNEPLHLQHRDCGEITHPELVCDKCGEKLHQRSFRNVPGPGFTDDWPYRSKQTR
jgi:DNA-binding HxlR family transcriptional regulator